MIGVENMANVASSKIVSNKKFRVLSPYDLMTNSDSLLDYKIHATFLAIISALLTAIVVKSK